MVRASRAFTRARAKDAGLAWQEKASMVWARREESSLKASELRIEVGDAEETEGLMPVTAIGSARGTDSLHTLLT